MPGKPSQHRPRCRATTATGRPCRKPAASGAAYCAAHGGSQRKYGRRTKLTADLTTTIAQSIQRGVTLDVAATAAGIHPSTLHDWRNRGETDLDNGNRTIYAEFADELTRAQAMAEENLVQSIRSHALIDWRAGAWLLERRAPERWSLKHRDGIDPATAERALPRDVEPGSKRDTILGILDDALRPPAGTENTP